MGEMPVAGCFLCEPDPDLIFAESGSARALCGLGPISDGYSLVATRGHISSAADALPALGKGFLDFTASVRNALVDRFGSCLLSEHGRVPLCAQDVAADRHCYHAHFLLFPA